MAGRPTSAPTVNDDGATRRRRSLVIGGVLIAIVALAVVLLAVRSGDDVAEESVDEGRTVAGESQRADNGSVTSAPADSDSGQTEQSPANSSGTGDATADPSAVVSTIDPALAVLVDPIQPGPEIEVCAAVMARLLEFRKVMDSSTGPDPITVEAMNELESSIMTLADNQDWGDRIAPELTGVLREWASVGAAEEANEVDRVARSSERALEYLDRAVEVSDCPTN